MAAYDRGVAHALGANGTLEDEISAVHLGPGCGIVVVAHGHVDLFTILGPLASELDTTASESSEEAKGADVRKRKGSPYMIGPRPTKQGQGAPEIISY